MKIILNPEAKAVAIVRRGLEENGGYCPCRADRTEDTKCMCAEFRNEIGDPDFTGFCRCTLYCKVN